MLEDGLNRRDMHIAQKPQFSEHEANRFLDGFRTAILVYNIADRKMFNMDEAIYQNLSK